MASGTRYARLQAILLAATLRERWHRPAAALLPPPRLRQRVHGSVDPVAFDRVGRICAADLRRQLATLCRDVASFDRVLEFGCGCGRVARHMEECRRLHATDVDRAAIAWCRRHLPGRADWQVNDPHPPLRYAAGSFDLIYAVSVFTHLDAAAQLAWLGELGRVARRGAVLLLTVHGAHYRDVLTPALRSRLVTDGFVCDRWPDRDRVNAFHTRAYVYREWSRFLTIVRYEERALNESQDVVVLRND